MSTSLTKSSFVLEAEPPAESQDPFRWLEDDENLDLTLDDYHTHIRTALPTPLPSTRRPSFRRTLSLNSLALARNSSSSKKSPSSPLTSNPPTPTQSSHRRPLSIVPPRSRHASRASISTIDPTAKHYRDPEARLKLRVYLASPQKFDEAIEFGFPSLETRDSFSQNRPEVGSRRTNGSARTFLEDDSGSLFEDEHEHIYKDADEGSSIDETDSPLTPKTPVPRTSRSLRHGTSESSSGPIRPRRTPSRSESNNQLHHHRTPTTVNREMTLHMTLTRPDLRTADDIAATKQSEDDPLRLAELPTTDAVNPIWDTLPPEGGMVRKMWRKLRHR
jgi:hypothetical protein